MSARHRVADTFDVMSGGVRYRVFLLTTSLQIDLSFWPHAQFRATQAAFRLLFGEANAPTIRPAPLPDDATGMGWLYANHARSAIARGRYWQALMMLDGLRDAILTMRSIVRGLNPVQGREVDQLPDEALKRLADARGGDLTADELRRSLRAHVEEYLDAIGIHDDARRAELEPTLRVIAESAQ